MIDHGLPCRKVCLLGWFHERQPLDTLGLGKQLVVAALLIWLEPIPALLSGHHDLKRSAKVQRGARKELVRLTGQAAHAGQLVAGVGLQLLAQRGGNQLWGVRR